ncbi:hypothetical protein ND748_28935 [Frankia sp. AiPs1]|uniref:hypothetical protein n=1 Tax=Frankia sp. AiPs1 TaxID=573493 RepID=UPI002043CDB7|nr:hypothetical protein [Frankia sp. AiPs1]MCM3925683.1 hypothetical protein [Frankia sp. AiPs1]
MAATRQLSPDGSQPRGQVRSGGVSHPPARRVAPDGQASWAAVEHRPSAEVQPVGQDFVAATVHPALVREPLAQVTVGAALHLPVERTRLAPGGHRDAAADAPGPAAARPTG